jgi:formate C-acetyltransferase
LYIGATPDGRLDGEPISDGISPSMNVDKKGPTATLNSVGKLPHNRFAGGQLLNQKFTTTALANQSGREKFASLIRTYAGDFKGMQIQVNVVDRSTLLDAQENPDKHSSLLVRVAGYTAYFTRLSRDLQDAIIQRSEQSWDM